MAGMSVSGSAERKPSRIRRKRVAFQVVVIAVGLSWAALALAGEGDKVAAKAHYEAANKYYDLHEYEDAVKEYKAAYFAKPDPAFLFNIGQCYRKLGKADQAIDFFREYLKKASPDDPNRANAEARVRELELGSASEADASLKAPPPPTQAVLSPVAQPAPSAQAAQPYAGPPPAAHPMAGADLTSTEPPSPRQTPFYRRWWFWTGVGAAVVAGTVTAIVLAGGGSEPNSANAGLGTRGVFQ
jgi:hypothetical protein